MNTELYNKILKQQQEVEAHLAKLYEEDFLRENAVRYNEGVIIGLGTALKIISEE